MPGSGQITQRGNRRLTRMFTYQVWLTDYDTYVFSLLVEGKRIAAFGIMFWL